MTEPYIGEIRFVGFNFEPLGWMRCSGQLLPIAGNDALFTLIGTTYGGDGQVTFALPDLRSRLPVHSGSGGGGTYTIGEQSGAETVTLTTQQLPAHTHPIQVTTALANQGTPGAATPAQAPTVQVYAEDSPLSAFAPGAVTTVGGSQPHDNQHPYLVLNAIIALDGIYPPPN